MLGKWKDLLLHRPVTVSVKNHQKSWTDIKILIELRKMWNMEVQGGVMVNKLD